MAKNWTILVYLSGDNNLAENGVDNINEMAKVGSNDDINIVAQFNRAGKWGLEGSTSQKMEATTKMLYRSLVRRTPEIQKSHVNFMGLWERLAG